MGTCPNCGYHRNPFSPHNTLPIAENTAMTQKHNDFIQAIPQSNFYEPSYEPSAEHFFNSAYTHYMQEPYNGYPPSQPIPGPSFQGYPPNSIDHHHQAQPYQSQAPTTTHTPPHPTNRLRLDMLLQQMVLPLLIITSLLLVLSGAGLLYFTHITHSSTRLSHHDHITDATTTDNQSNTQTAMQDPSTTSSMQDLYKSRTSGKPDIHSLLAFQTDANWDVYPTQDGGGCAFMGNALHASVHAPNYYIPCIAHATNYHNFALQIDMKLLKGDEGGIIFRASNQNKNFYSFRIRSDGSYRLIKTKDETHATTLIYDTTPGLHTQPGQDNQLTVIVQDQHIFLYINQQFVSSTSDATYTAGSIGVIALDHQHETDVAFSNLDVWSF
jgi:hypothetical protein